MASELRIGDTDRATETGTSHAVFGAAITQKLLLRPDLAFNQKIHAPPTLTSSTQPLPGYIYRCAVKRWTVISKPRAPRGGLFYSSRHPPPNAPGWGIGGFCLRAQPLLYLRLASQLCISPLRSLFHLTKKLQTPGAQDKIKNPGFQEQSEVPHLFSLKKRGGGGSEATPWDVLRPPESRGAVSPGQANARHPARGAPARTAQTHQRTHSRFAHAQKARTDRSRPTGGHRTSTGGDEQAEGRAPRACRHHRAHRQPVPLQFFDGFFLKLKKKEGNGFVKLIKLFRLSLSEGSTICFANALTCQSLEKHPQSTARKPSLSLPTPSTGASTATR